MAKNGESLLRRPVAGDPVRDVRLPFHKRLSFKQARNTALFTFAVSMCLSLGQIFFDYLRLEKQTEEFVGRVLRTLQEPAAEAAYAFDRALASQVLQGLLEFPQVKLARIKDDFGAELAFRERPAATGALKWLADRVLDPSRVYRIDLIIRRHNQPVGVMTLALDNLLVTNEFLSRSALLIGTGVVWSAALAGILVVMFYVSITKPFLQMTHSLARVDPWRPDEQLLKTPPRHDDDEMGLLARTINDLLKQSGASLRRHQEAEERVREREARLSGIMDNVADGIITIDRHNNVQTMNTAAQVIFGYGPDQIAGLAFADLVAPADLRRVLVALARSVDPIEADGRRSFRQELTGMRRDGRTVPISFGISLMRLGDQVTFICVVQDITERKQSEAALRESEERLKLAVTVTRSGVWDWNLETNRFWWSPEFGATLGYPETELGHATRGLWESLVHPDDLIWCRTLAHRFIVGEVQEYQPVYRMRRRDGSWSWVEDKALAVRDESGRALRLTGTLTDVTERRQFEEQLMYMATHDPLTSLPNRTLLQDRLAHALNLTRQKGSKVGVLFIDLDRFKLINDSLGHPTGDRLLRSVAEILLGIVGETDTVGRLGGDEFLVIVEDIRDAQEVGRIAGAILTGLSRPIGIDDHQLFITASIGISIGSGVGTGTDIAGLLRHADTAMYSAKTTGGNTYRYFMPEMNEEAVARLDLEHKLREAVEEEQFLVYFQPKVNLATMRPVGAEALIRWRRPDGGFVSPAKFIPVAEETGLIDVIGAWVLKTVIRQLGDWRQRGIPVLPVAVNVSVRQLTSGDLAERIRDLLVEAGVSPSCLELELTETAMMSNIESMKETLSELRRLGLHIAVDDFGTGYSSLSYLRRLPITALKVDQSFISDATSNDDDAAIAATIIAMGQKLGLKVVAEGIEESDQIAFLSRHGCHEMQGFLLARPMPAAEFEMLWHPDSGWRLPGHEPAGLPEVSVRAVASG